MNLREMNWSKAEKETARQAFARAYRKECGVIVAKIRDITETASEPEDLWRIHDLLTRERKQTDAEVRLPIFRAAVRVRPAPPGGMDLGSGSSRAVGRQDRGHPLSSNGINRMMKLDQIWTE